MIIHQEKNHAEIYALIASNKGELCKVLFEPNETIIEGFFVKAPRKSNQKIIRKMQKRLY